MFIKQKHGVTQQVHTQWTAETDKQHSTHSPANAAHYTHTSEKPSHHILEPSSGWKVPCIKKTNIEVAQLEYFKERSSMNQIFQPDRLLWTERSESSLCSRCATYRKAASIVHDVKLCDSWLCNTHIRPYVRGRDKDRVYTGGGSYFYQHLHNLSSLYLYKFLLIYMYAHTCAFICIRFNPFVFPRIQTHDLGIACIILHQLGLLINIHPYSLNHAILA